MRIKIADGLWWESYCEGWTDRTDGYLTDGNRKLGLDIATGADDCCVTMEELREAEWFWHFGQVLLSRFPERHGSQTLVVPEDLNLVVVTEALRRYRP